MKLLKLFLFLVMSMTLVQAQSFYSLTGVDSYDPMVINSVKETARHNDDIKTLMQGVSDELGIDTKGHPSRVLVFVIKKFSVGESIGIKVALELGEYVKRKGMDMDVFAITYKNEQTITPMDGMLEEQLSDSIEELLEAFRLQHIEDNKERLAAGKSFSHESFSKEMQYETDYALALNRAKKENKPLMVFMSTSYCPWCRKLESQILAKEGINKKIHEKYVPLMLNLDKKKFPAYLAKTKITPALYIVNAKSEKIEEKFVGYNNRGAFLHTLKK